ncbi:MAG: hypothetical protein NTW94_00195 [Legionellales bacterium]|nr:hypothetical protein [Legionellales bacterium]
MKTSTKYLFIAGAAIFLNHGAFSKSNSMMMAQDNLKVYSSKQEIISPKNFTQSIDNKINGEVPPGKIGGVNEIILSQMVDGMHRYVSRVTRGPGLRVYVHYHHFPVTTCILKGQTTLYLEGYQPKITKAGHCFTMPANIKGVNYNSGKETAIFMDFMVLPVGVDTIVPLESAPGKSQM